MELQTAAAILGAVLPEALINKEILHYIGIEDSLCQLKKDNPALVRWLIARGAKVSYNNYMSFAQATIMGCIDNLRVLFGHPDINLFDLQCFWSPVDIALSHGYVDILRFLFGIGLTFTDQSVYYIRFSV